MSNRIIICYGVPRSGTTYLLKLLENSEHKVYKLPETVINHPCNSDYGLTSSKKLLGDDVEFVRIHRSPTEIFKSFVAARMIVSESGMDAMDGIANNTDEHIIKMILHEANNSRIQYRLGLDIVNLDYANMNPTVLENKFGVDVANYHANNFKVNPVRGGRLSYGVEVDLTSEQKQLLSGIDNRELK